jgi:hypothetical protein
VTATITHAVPIEAFMGGLGVGLVVVFVTLLLTLGAALIRRFLDA